MLKVCNPSEYEGRVWIELDGVTVAFEERGLPEIAGPFASVKTAADALREHREYLEWRGYRVAL